jgi:hypothetical protein
MPLSPDLPAVTPGKSLFSRHFLENHLPALPEWAEDAQPVYERLSALWERAQRFGPNWNESQTEQEFLRPALELLGWSFIPQTTSRRGNLARPDYALFRDAAAKDEAYPLKNNEDAFYSRSLAIAEAKHWGRPLSHQSADGRDQWDRQTNPSHQMVSYLIGTRCPWGILTNGQLWRLYSREASSTASEFYEVDLGAVFAAPPEQRLDDLKLWWLFFRRAAFIPDAQGLNFVQRVASGSASYARKVSDTLKELVYREVMPEVAAGFIAYRREQLGIATETKEGLAEIYRASLALLYKLLFILYAEARQLLPVDNPAYQEESLTRMAKEFADRIDRRAPISEATHATGRYDRLLALFHRIDRGDPALGVPRYDGGLFNPETPENRFLEQHRLSDRAVAKAVDLLVRDAGQPVDYGYISVRNLGSIYEGLLENRLEIVRAPDGSPTTRVELVNDRGVRRATGSYYTPDDIVDYIVRQTLGPVLDERAGQFSQAMDRIAELRRDLHRTSDSGAIGILRQELETAELAAREAFLGIKVCDPAMGSGHFLVNAVDFLTDGIIGRMQRYHDEHRDVLWEWNPIQRLINRVRDEITAEMARQGITVDAARLDDTSLLTRLVMKRCVYGVDLNRMAVELAKLSLWLHSFTVGAPLSFLDHHLRWGNSLIGTDVRTVQAALTGQVQVKKVTTGSRRLAEGRGEAARETASGFQFDLFGGPFAGLLGLTAVMIEVAARSDATLADVRQSAEEFDALQKNLTPYKRALDLWVSRYFGNTNADALLTLHGSDLLLSLRGERPLDRAWNPVVEKARKLWEEKRFFHWDLEFPEVFVDLARRDWAENPGFDAVIGNPPYDVLAEKERREDLSSEMKYVEAEEVFNPALGGKLDLYRLFIARKVQRTTEYGHVGVIIPMSVLADQQTAALRRFLLTQTTLLRVHAFPQKDDPARRVFSEAKLPTCVLIIRKSMSDGADFQVIVHPGRQLDEVSGRFSWSRADALLLDDDFLPIPLLSSDMAVKLVRKVCAGTNMRRMGTVCPTYQGEINETTLASLLSTDPNSGPRVLRGGNVQRYELLSEPKQGETKYLNVSKYELMTGGERGKHTQMPRIGYQRNAALDNWRRLIASPLPQPSYCFDSISYFVARDRTQAMAYLALLNAQLMEWRFRLTSTNNHVSTSELAALPIYRFTFSTSRDDRVRLAKEGRLIYEECLRGDSCAVLAFVDTQLLPSEGAAARSDVVHDLLAYLAEQMIAMNVAKQAEMKGFLTWLARHIGAPLDSLNNKTVLLNYLGDYQKGEPSATLEQMLRVLNQNKARLSVDPDERAFQERLQAEHDASLAKLLPLKQRLAGTDRLIDQIVYRLYGLTEDEIAIVEGRHS